jgi:uncharacterized protein (DUF1810 family)
MSQKADSNSLERFVQAQDPIYSRVLDELSQGDKRSHWMWFVFPQIQGLGRSPTAQYYALGSLDEARAYLAHPVLGRRLIECAGLLQKHTDKAASAIFGSPDDLKLHSCLTLFQLVADEHVIFQQLLDQFFAGEYDDNTLRITGQKTEFGS